MGNFLPRWCVVWLTLAVASGSSRADESYQWRNVAIKGGGFVSGLVYHPVQPGVFYARTDVGGAFRWQPETASWRPLNDDLGKDDSQLTGVVSLALDPHDANRLYLACGQYLPSWAQHGAILISTDRGATWSRSTLAINLGGNSDGRSTGERLQVDPNQGAILLLGSSQDGLWKSADHAQTWTKLNGFPAASLTFVLFDPRGGPSGQATATIYAGAATTSASALYRSSDGGATWSAVPRQPAGLLVQHAKLADDGTLYLTYADNVGPNNLGAGAVWKLKTADDMWTNITPPPAGQGGFAGLALDAQHPGTVVVTTLDRWSPRDEIYRSTDAGATWKALNALSTYDTSSAPYAAAPAHTPHWTGAIEIDPFNSGRAFFITGYGVFGTENLTAADTNSPITWAFRDDGLEETVPLGFVSPPSGAPLVSVIGDIDGFRHDDLTVSPPRGQHSVSVGTNNSIDFAELAPAQMVRTHSGGTQRGSRSIDGGTTWTYFASAPAAATAGNPGVIAISADGARLVWAPTHAAAYTSTDGRSWTASAGGPAASANTSFTPVADRVNAAKFYLYDSAAGQVYASTDGGVNFATAATGLPTGGDPLRAVPGREGHLWLTAWNGGLYRSTNSGATFTRVAGVEEGYRIGFGRADDGQAYPAIYLWAKISGVTGFFRSTDEGATWTRINDAAHQFGWINAIAGDPRVFGRVYLATGGRGIIYGESAKTVPTITWPVPAPVVHGTTLSGGQLNATADVAGTFAYTPALGTMPGVGTQELWVTFTPTDRITYATTSAHVSLTVGPASGPVATSRLVNIATRAYCSTGNRVTIGGFVVAGGATKRVLVRAVGPTLTTQGIGPAEVLLDPAIEVHDALHGNSVIATNDDWGDNPNAADITAVGAQFGATALAAGDTKSSALLLTLPAGIYSFVVNGKAGTSGVVLLEVYEADAAPSGATFVNIATRAYSTTGNGVTIGGFVIAGSAPKLIYLRAVGPTLTTQGLGGSDVLADPVIELHDAIHGNVVIATNDDAGANANAAALLAAGARIGATPLDGSDATSSALLVTLAPGVYSFIASGKAGASGVALVEVYDAD